MRLPKGENSSSSSSSSNGGRLGVPSRELGREPNVVTFAPGVGEREGMTSGAAIARLEEVRVRVGAAGLCAQRSGEGVPRPWSELTERERVSVREVVREAPWAPCSAERVRVRGCMSEGRGLNSFALRKRGEERGDEVGLVFVARVARVAADATDAADACRTGGDEAGESDDGLELDTPAGLLTGLTTAVALMWRGDEVTGVCGLRAVDACMNEIALGELAGELESRRNECVDARLDGRDGRLGVETRAAVNGTWCWSLRCLCIISRIVDSICRARNPIRGVSVMSSAGSPAPNPPDHPEFPDSL